MSVASKFAIKGFVFSLVFSALVFVSSGRINFVEGWIYFGTSMLTTFLDVFTARKNEELMTERSKPGEGTKSWDKRLLGLSALVFIATIVLAGLDSGRFAWSPHVPWFVNAFGVILVVTGQTIFLAARKENKFFSTVVRIQKERGHTVCETGIYKLVRHPGYLGMIISTIGFPFVFGSLWCLIPTVLAVALLCVRTWLEDRTLKDELAGYVDYTRKTAYKLVPWVW